MVDMNRIERHLGKGKAVTLKNADGVEDTFEFKPLGAEHLSDLFGIMRTFKNASSKGMKPEQIMDNLDDVTLARLSRLIMATLKNAMPDVPQEKLSVLSMQYFVQMMTVVFELNDFGASRDIELKKRIESMKGPQNEADGKVASTGPTG